MLLREDLEDRIARISGSIESYNNKTASQVEEKDKVMRRISSLIDDVKLDILGCRQINRLNRYSEVESIKKVLEGISSFESVVKMESIPSSILTMVFNSILEALRTMVSNVSWTNRYVKSNFLLGTQDYLPNDKEGSCFNSYANNHSDAKSFYFDLNSAYIKNIINQTVTGDHKINIMVHNFPYYPSSYEFKNLDKVKPENVNIYATAQEGYAFDLKNRQDLEGVAIGNESNNIITNKCFDFIISRVNYDDRRYHLRNDFGKPCDPENLSCIRRLSKYVRDNGLIFLTLPSFTLSKEICLLLKKTFILKNAQLTMVNQATDNDDPHLMLFPDVNVRQDISFVTLVLQKKDELQMSEDEHERQYQLLRSISLDPSGFLKEHQEEFGLSNKTDFTDAFAKTFIPVKIFRGTCADPSILMLTIQNSPLYSIKEDIKSKPIEPPLPFEKGQIGLILASGKLDGVVHEKNGFNHVIRGRVYKATRTSEELEVVGTNHGRHTTTHVTSNVTEINVMAGDGTFKKVMVPVTVN